MQTRDLGRSDIQVVPLMFGGNVFGWTIDEAKSFEILDAFADQQLASLFAAVDLKLDGEALEKLNLASSY